MSSVSDTTPPATVGTVIDGCRDLLSSLKTQAERDAVITALLAMAPPAGLKKLVARLPGTGANGTTISNPTTSASKPPEAMPQKDKKKKGKQAPPKAKPWAKEPAFLALKEVQKKAASVLVAAKAANGGKDLAPDHQLVIDFNSARTAVQNFRP
jgi:hypothetical protein